MNSNDDEMNDEAKAMEFSVLQAIGRQQFDAIVEELSKRAGVMTDDDGVLCDAAIDNPQVWSLRDLILMLIIAEPMPSYENEDEDEDDGEEQ